MTGLERIAVMFFGALVALAGLVLLFYRRDQGQNRIKVLGQEFEISTPALVVFLAGCGIFVLPFFYKLDVAKLGDKDVAKPATATTTPGSVESKAPNGSPVTLETEAEPNDDFDDATQIALGSSVRGHISVGGASEGDSDYYKLRTTSSARNQVKLRVKGASTLGLAVFVYDENRKQVAHEIAGNRGQIVNLLFSAKPNAEYFLRIVHWSTQLMSGDYTLETTVDTF